MWGCGGLGGLLGTRVMFIFEVAGSCRIEITFSRGFVRLFSLGQELILVKVVTMLADWS